MKQMEMGQLEEAESKMDLGKEACGKNERRIIYAIVLFSYFASGIPLFLFGPVWPELTLLLDSDGEAMKEGHMARLIGGLVGVITCTPLAWYINRPLLMVISLAVQAANIAIMPHTGYHWFLGHFASIGFMSAISSTLSMVWILELWACTSKLNITVQFAQLVFASSAFTCSTVVRPFLPGKKEEDDEILDTLSMATARPKYQTRIHIPMLIMALIMLASAIVMLPLFLRDMKRKITGRGSDNEKKVHRERTSSVVSVTGTAHAFREKAAIEEEYAMQDASPLARWSMVGFVVLFVAGFAGYDILSTSYLFTFLIKTDLGISNSTAGWISASYGMGSVVGILIAIPIGLIVKPIYIIIGTLSLLFLSSLTFFSFYETSVAAMWAAAVLYGLGIATSYGCILGILSSLIEVTNFVGSLLSFGSLIGGAAFLRLFAGQIDKNPGLMPFVTMFAALSMFSSLLAVIVIVGVARPAQFRQLVL